MKNLIGQKFGKLTVIEKTQQRKHNNIVWKCKCECGNEHYAYTNLLTSGGCKSCGCLQSETASKLHSTDNIIGHQFGLLTAIEKDKSHKAPNGSYMIKCRCECGKEILATPQNLRSGHTNSCGCLKMSVGELKIYQLLKENNIPFEREKSFETCRNPITNYPLRFDFYVNNQYLIEYDGRQHFLVDGGWDEPLEVIQARDKYKNEWCEKNNIPLIRISYLQLPILTINHLLIDRQHEEVIPNVEM